MQYSYLVALIQNRIKSLKVDIILPDIIPVKNKSYFFRKWGYLTVNYHKGNGKLAELLIISLLGVQHQLKLFEREK